MRNKYNAKKVSLDGYDFDSLMEARRYGQLKLMVRAGLLRELRVHPSWPIVVNGHKICHVELDFSYVDEKDIQHHEDVKGQDTALSRIKRKLLLGVHGICVELIKKV